MRIESYKRIVVVGNNGSGKSYLSRELAKITGLPLTHLDAVYWKPNWEQPTRDEWIQLQSKLTSNNKWIMDGNHTSTMDIRFRKADLIIFINEKRFMCLLNVLRRSRTKRADMPDYLKDRFDLNYFKFLKGLWNFSKSRELNILNLIKKYPNKDVLIIQGRQEMNKMLDIWHAKTGINHES